MTDNKPKNNESLDSFFSSIGSEKKKIKEETKELIGDISLDDVFSSINEETKKLKEKILLVLFIHLEQLGILKV